MRTLAVLVLIGLSPGPPPAAAQQPDELLLAVLRRDNRVIPFAAFDGRRWSRDWPERMPLEMPISIDDVPDPWWGVKPPPRRFTLWSEGVRSGEVTTQALAVTRLMCQPRLVLTSDHKSTAPTPPQFVLPYPKDGLLVAGNATVTKIETVEPGETWNRVEALATMEFNKQEKRAAGAFRSWRHPIKEDQRRLVPIRMEALYRAPMDEPGWTAYFMEAVRQFPAGPDEKDGCGLATYASGWVLTGPKNESRVFLAAQVTYCDRKGVGYMLPFGVISARGKSYWVFQYSGFEFESYEVTRPTRDRIESAVVYSAGTCGR